jgi:serine/threonine protein kinase
MPDATVHICWVKLLIDACSLCAGHRPLPADPPSDEAAEEAELDRLAAELGKGRELPEDLVELMWAIATKSFVRMAEPDAALHQFERFEALDTKFGGMGMIIEARDPQLDRKVAIKLWMSTGAQAEAALRAEAKTLAKLSHPNIVTVYETGTWKGRVYFVMEWVEGVDGHEWMKKLRTWRRIRDIFAAAGTGLAAAHDAGIQHRDFKPANMLIGNDDRVLIADFGVADTLRAIGVDDGVVEDQLSQIVGTLGYMAPERLRGGPGSARSDQFSFCASMWQVLHRRRPFAGETAEALLEAIEGGVIEPGDASAEVPHWLNQVLRKGLAFDPDRRHRDMHELVRALQDEPPTNGESSEDEAAKREPINDDGRLLHAPMLGPHEALSARQWRFFSYGVMATITALMLIILALALFLRSGQPETAAREALQPTTTQLGTTHTNAVDEILALVQAGSFSEARTAWQQRRASETKPGLDADESLTIGRACLEQAKRLERVAPEQSGEAARLVFDISEFVIADKRIEAAGRRLGEELKQFREGSGP